MSLTATPRLPMALWLALVTTIGGGCANATARSLLATIAVGRRSSDDAPDDTAIEDALQDELFKQAGIRRLPPVDAADAPRETALDGAIADDATRNLLQDPLVRPAATWDHDFSLYEPWPAQPDGIDIHAPLFADSPREELTFMGLLGDQVSHIRSDHLEFYSQQGLTSLAIGLGSASLMANTNFDEHFLRDTYFDNIIRAPTHEYYERLHQPKFLGEGYYTIPAFAAAALAEPLIDHWPVGSQTAEWGQRSLRTILVGGPPMLGLQTLTGGSRPGESSVDSHWKPLDDDNGVSGHAFMGAVPILSAAKMTDDIWWKGGLYVASALPALSRVNDSDHYLSQSFLGWWIAYVAASAVDRSEDARRSQTIFPFVTSNQIGLGVQRTY